MDRQVELTQAFAAARQRREDVRDALGALERALAAPAPGREAAWGTDAASAARTLLDAWDAHVVTTEDPDGLFAEVMERAPRLAHQIDRLRAEHDLVRAELDAALDRLVAVAAGNDHIDDAREVALAALAGIVRHRHRGADLVWEAYNADIGAAD